jgi:hypothetical protein
MLIALAALQASGLTTGTRW